MFLLGTVKCHKIIAKAVVLSCCVAQCALCRSLTRDSRNGKKVLFLCSSLCLFSHNIVNVHLVSLIFPEALGSMVLGFSVQ